MAGVSPRGQKVAGSILTLLSGVSQKNFSRIQILCGKLVHVDLIRHEMFNKTFYFLYLILKNKIKKGFSHQEASLPPPTNFCGSSFVEMKIDTASLCRCSLLLLLLTCKSSLAQGAKPLGSSPLFNGQLGSQWNKSFIDNGSPRHLPTSQVYSLTCLSCRSRQRELKRRGLPALPGSSASVLFMEDRCCFVCIAATQRIHPIHQFNTGTARTPVTDFQSRDNKSHLLHKQQHRGD